MTQYSYSFSNQRRDFTPVYKLLAERSPTVLSLFKIGKPVENTTFSYYDYIESPVTCQLAQQEAAGQTVLTCDTFVGEFAAGDTIIFKDGNYEERTVESCNNTDTLTVSAALSYTHEDNCVILRTGTPKVQGSTASAEDIGQGTARTNYTTILRKDIKVAGSKLKIGDEDFNDDAITRGVNQKFRALYRDLATKVLYGDPLVASAGVAGKTASLHYWLSQSSALKEDESAADLTAKMINDMIETINNKSGEDPDAIVCSAQTARKIAKMNTATTNAMVIISADTIEGGGVRQVTAFSGDLTGTGVKKILVDPNMADTNLLILNTEYLELCPLNDRAFYEWDSTTAGFDGVERSILGEYGTKIWNPYHVHGMVYDFTVSL